MHDFIICQKCKNKIPLSDAISHQINEKYKSQIEELEKKHEDDRLRLIELSKKRIHEEKEKTAREVELTLKEKVRQEMELALKNTENEARELKLQRKQLQDELLARNTTVRQLQDQNRMHEIELTKKLAEESKKIEENALKRAQEEHRLKDLEKEKIISDLKKSLEDAKRKAELGSQQMQGEVLELEIEDLLRKEFPQDEISEVPKGVTGADIIQKVKQQYGKLCGTIVWETKRTRNWSDGWIEKLKNDMRIVKAEIAVLVSEVLPTGISTFSQKDGVWICAFEYMTSLAHVLRQQLIEVAAIKRSVEGKKDKMELLFQYVNSIEFTHRIEAIHEAFTNMQEEIEREKRWFAQKWAREEKNLRNVFDHTFGMKGDLESITGKIITEPSFKKLPTDENTKQDRLV